METATRYFDTIEKLMTDNSRLTKELADAVNGKMPSRIISQEMADECFNKIAGMIGPVASGSLLDEITAFCNEYMKLAQDYRKVAEQNKYAKSQETAIEKIVKGEDLDESYIPTALVSNVSRLRAVLEVSKTRLARLVSNGINDVAELYNDVATFLDGKNE